MTSEAELLREEEHARNVLGSDDAVLVRRYVQASRLWAWKDGSLFDYMAPARRKLKRAERIFKSLGIRR